LLIFDEVYSFRLGFNGAQGALGVNPDLTALGKVIGGGLPIGAVGGRADIMEAVFDPRAGRTKMTHGGTFHANPMTMAAGGPSLICSTDRPSTASAPWAIACARVLSKR
jgi:glutamate-1-semialdehyde 2,1-aminomutase